MSYEDYTEKFRHKERKEQRQQRQISSFKDRSKFKKTDRSKWDKKRQEKEAELSKRGYLKGRIIGILSEGVQVKTEDKKTLLCFLRGVLKKENIRKKNLAAVGDYVLLEETPDNEGVIIHIDERKSVLSRAHNHHQRQEHIIAANVDQVLVTLSVVTPPLKASLADRYIIAARKGNMETVLVINKIDLLQDTKNEHEQFEEFLTAYREAGFQVIPVSTMTGEGIEQLKEAMKGKTSVFAGQSGTGKSSLINTITQLDLAVGETVKKTGKGSHTTTTSRLIFLDFGGWCVDTPGIKSFGLWELRAEEVQNYFPEIAALQSECRFPDCSHTHEPECQVLEAVKNNKLSKVRYGSYLSIFTATNKKHRPR